MTPKCPKCSATVTHVMVTALDGRLPHHILASVAFACPACGVVLGVSADPLAIKVDTIAEIVKALGKGDR